jgi:hypothetical protein
MSYRFEDSFRTGPGWNFLVLLENFLQVLLESCLQTCMTYISAECTVNKLLVMGSGTARNM